MRKGENSLLGKHEMSVKILILIRLNRKRKHTFDGLKNEKLVLIFLRE